jgi:hypothetical protein
MGLRPSHFSRLGTTTSVPSTDPPYRDRFVIARFEVVSTDFAKVIRRPNEYFGTSFREFEHTEGYAARCFAILVAHERVHRQHRDKGCASV